MNASTNRRQIFAALVTFSLLFTYAGASLAGPGQGYLGVMLQDINPSMAKALQMGERTGVLVLEVVDDSPADEAGLSDGDVILEFDGQEIDGASALTEAVRGTKPDDKVKLLVLRDGKQEKIKVRLGTRDADDFAARGFDFPPNQNGEDEDGSYLNLSRLRAMLHPDHGFLGVSLENITDQLGKYFKVENGAGALISEVNEDSPAEASGLQAGDVIVAVDDQDITSVATLMEAMQKTEPGDKVDLKVVRKGKHKSFTVTLAEMPENPGLHAMNKWVFTHEGEDNRCDSRLHHFPGQDDDNVFFHRGMKGSPQIRVLREEIEDSELDQVHEELDNLREELDQLRQEMQKIK